VWTSSVTARDWMRVKFTSTPPKNPQAERDGEDGFEFVGAPDLQSGCDDHYCARDQYTGDHTALEGTVQRQ